MAGYRKSWLRLAKLGSLPADMHPHVLRHSFASQAGDLGYGEATIAALIGHKGHSITSRYVHSADTVLLAAADPWRTLSSICLGSGQQQPRSNQREAPDRRAPRPCSQTSRVFL
jgi:hypothetical protein